jgi:hypothetical protein
LPLTPGARLGPYEILAPLGAVGMGDRAGLLSIDGIVMTPDARSCAYSYFRCLTDLHVVDGLR